MDSASSTDTRSTAERAGEARSGSPRTLTSCAGPARTADNLSTMAVYGADERTRQPLPNFLVIGGMKCGTTSLYRYLRCHPDVFMTSPKELHFFSHRGGVDLSWYAAHFRGAGVATALGEASASYTTYPDCEDVPERIARALPTARLIYLVRDPVARMRSHYLQRLGAGLETLPIDQALFVEPTYLETSMYARRLERYLERFDAEQIAIIRSEDLLRERRSTLRRIFRFLHVNETFWDPAVMASEYYETSEKRVPRPIVHRVRHVRSARWLARHSPSVLAMFGRRIATHRVDIDAGSLEPRTEERVRELLRDDVQRLRAHLDPEFDGWGIA